MPCRFSEQDNKVLAGSLIKSILRLDTDKRYDFQGEHYMLNMKKAFEYMLESIFTSNAELIKKIDSEDEIREINTKEHFVHFFQYDIDLTKTIQFAVGQKLSDKIEFFNEEEIKSKSISISNTAVLRVITKWAEELREILRDPYEKFIINNKFVSKKGEILIFNKETRKVMY